MTSSANEKISRASGTFTPEQDMVGYLLGVKCYALHSLAQAIDDGVWIRYNNETKRFDIVAKSVAGVSRAIHDLKARQAIGQQEKLKRQQETAKLVQAMASSNPSNPISQMPMPTPMPMPMPSMARVAGPVPVAWTPMVSFDQFGNRIEGVFRLETSMQIPAGWQIQSAELKMILISEQAPADDLSKSKLSNWVAAAAKPVTTSTSSTSSTTNPTSPTSPPIVNIGKAHPALSVPKSPMLGKPVTAKKWGEIDEQVEQGAVMQIPETFDGGSSSDEESSDDDETEDGWVKAK